MHLSTSWKLVATLDQYDPMSGKITIATLFALLAGVGVWNALRPRAAESEPPDVANERLAGIPKQIGDWTGSETGVNLKAMRIAEAEAYSSRTYANSKTNEAYSVMLLYGPPGDLGAHDPKTCYAGTGFERAGGSSRWPGAGSELWTARFERTTPPPKAALEVFWAWGTRGDWSAPDQPRLAFAGEGRIYKLYVQRAVSANDRGAEPKPAGDFLEPFLRVLKTALGAARP